MAKFGFLICKIGLLTLPLIGLGNCSSPSKRLGDGANVISAQYATNDFGSNCFAIVVTVSNSYCNGVMTSPTTFSTDNEDCSGVTPVSVYAGDFYHPSNPAFTGQTLNVTNTTAITYLNGEATSYTVSRIPSTSKGKPCFLNPPGSPAPGESAQCVALGYSFEGRLNTRPATITNSTVCSATHSTLYRPTTTFCAFVLNNDGKGAICGDDYATIIMCKQWVGVTRDDQLKEAPSPNPIRAQDAVETRLNMFCRFNGGSPLCAWLCEWNPFCGASFEEPIPSDQWYLAGILSSRQSSCNTAVTGPDLYDFFSNLTPTP